MTAVSCKTKEIVTSKKNEEIDSSFNIEFKKELTFQDLFVFTISNNSVDTLTILNPAIAYIEKLENETWRRVRIIYCPCGANCIPPPKVKQLLKGQNHKYKWNLKESWCGEKQENGIPETIEKDFQEGIYRIKIEYVFKRETKKIEKQFKIKMNNN